MEPFKLKPSVRYVDTKEKALRAVELAWQQPWSAVDTEFHQDWIGLMSYSWRRGESWVARFDDPEIVAVYRDWLASKKNRHVYQTAKEDIKRFEVNGIHAWKGFGADIEHLDWFHDENDLKHGLKHQSFKWLGWRRKEFQQLFSYVPAGKKKRVVLTVRQLLGLDQLPEDALRVRSARAWLILLLNYAGDDAESTWRLFAEVHRPYLERIGYWETYLADDRPFTRTLVEMQRRGVLIDRQQLARMERLVDIDMMRYQHAFRAECGIPDFNLNSSPQKHRLFIEREEWPIREDFATTFKDKKAGTEVPSSRFDKYALDWYAEDCGYVLAKMLRGYNQLFHGTKKFCKGVRLGIDPDGRIRTDFKQTGADTGRISSRKIKRQVVRERILKSGQVKTSIHKEEVGLNLLNVARDPRKDRHGVRRAFVAPKSAKTKLTRWLQALPALPAPGAISVALQQAIQQVVDGIPVVATREQVELARTKLEMLLSEPVSHALQVQRGDELDRQQHVQLRLAMRGDQTADGREALEDYSLVVGDYTGFELYMAIYWAGKFTPDSAMLKAAQAGKNLHALTAVRMGLCRGVSKKTVKKLKHSDRQDDQAAYRFYRQHRQDLDRPWTKDDEPTYDRLNRQLKLDIPGCEDLIKLFYKGQYDDAKRCNFNLLYGGRAKMLVRIFALGDMLSGVESIWSTQWDTDEGQESIARAQELIDAWEEAWPEMVTYQQEIIRFAHEHGYVLTISGWQAHLEDFFRPQEPDESDRDYQKRVGFGERKARNTPCQGSAANIAKRAHNKLERDEKLRQMSYRQFIGVYDEIVGECPTRWAAQVVRRKTELMKQPGREFGLPFELVVDCKQADDWMSAK